MTLSYFMYGFYIILYVYESIIVLDIILSWIPSIREFVLPRIIHSVADWYMHPFRGKLILGPLDLTPIIGIIILNVVQSLCFI